MRAKWTLSVLAVAVLPILVAAMAVLRIQRDGLAHVEKELEVAVVDDASGEVMRMMNQAVALAATAEDVVSDDRAPVDLRVARLKRDVARTAHVSSIAFFAGDGSFIDAVTTGDDYDPSLKALPVGEGFRRLRAPDGTLRLRYERRLTARAGTVVVTLSPDVMAARLRDLSLARFGADDRLYLLDEAGGAWGRGGRVEDPGARPPIMSALPSRTDPFGAELVLTTEIVDRGVPKVTTIRTIPQQRLAVVVERPTAEAFATLARARRAFALAAGVFAALAAMAGVLLARRTLRPIVGLSRLVESYAKRNFGARSEVRSADELGRLGASLEAMADELSASEVEIRRQAKVEANLLRYLPSDLAASAKAGAELALGGARRDVTVLFADVVAFSGFAERAPPERVVAFLNELFTILSEIVFRHHGMVDKFIGDSIMAVFQAPGEELHAHASRALATADDMHRFVASTAPRWKEEFGIDVQLAIGVASGEVLVGNLGSEARMEYTVIGDIVNVAARLETLARPAQTLTTPAVVAACPEFDFATLGEQKIRGRARPVEVYEVV